MKKALAVFLPCSIFFIHTCHYVLSDKVNEEIVNQKVIPLVKQWAPKVWLDPQEKFFPSNVSTFLKEVIPVQKDIGQSSNENTAQIPSGENSRNYHLVTIGNKDDLLKDHNSFLYGVNPLKEVVSVYAHVQMCDPDYNSFIVTYWFFYAFNEGKEISTLLQKLPLPKVLKRYLGKSRIVGNHIGDWEHVTLEIKNGNPTLLFLSVHNAGVVYHYDQEANSFVLSKANSKGLGKAQDPPETVQLDSGHPVLFLARGSHALWAGVGTHRYTRLQLRVLSDETDVGTPWETWQSVEVFYSDETTPDWYNYQGRWGNPATGCVTHAVCKFSDGPAGLATRHQDFQCSREHLIPNN